MNIRRAKKLRNNLVKDENGDLHADSHDISNRWKNYFSQLLNVKNVSDVRQIEVHALVPGPNRLEAEIAIAKLKKYKSPGSYEIPAELIQAGGEILVSTIHKLINSVWNKEELPDQGKESITVPVHKKGDKFHCNNYHAINFIQNFIEYSPLKVSSINRLNYWGSSVWVST
jgi:hypothetical protein